MVHTCHQQGSIGFLWVTVPMVLAGLSMMLPARRALYMLGMLMVSGAREHKIV